MLGVHLMMEMGRRAQPANSKQAEHVTIRTLALNYQSDARFYDDWSEDAAVKDLSVGQGI